MCLVLFTIVVSIVSFFIIILIGVLFTAPPTYKSINRDSLAILPDSLNLGKAIDELKNESVLSAVRPYNASATNSLEEHKALHSSRPNSDISFPHTYISTPVHEIPTDPESKIVAHVAGLFAWDYALRFLLPDNVDGIIVELRNSCNQSSLYALVGSDAFYLGDNATNESKYDNMEVVRDLSFSTHPNFTTTPGHCRYTIVSVNLFMSFVTLKNFPLTNNAHSVIYQHVFPSTTFQKSYKTSTPAIYAAVVAFTFVLVALVFFIYDMLVQLRNEKIIVTAARSSAIVSSMFPDTIRDRLLERNDARAKRGHLKSFLLNGDEENSSDLSTKPLADLFLETTVLFADISGFTAWSSVRDPTQVLSLLEALYNAFDTIANRRRVFKVETVGDCYVAVTGLPEPQKDHAVIMARFARDIMNKMEKVTRELELTLGPGTADLKLRIGMHSGPVTGGVLRGERSRFQLFGDTMNTTARVESTGVSGCIQMSSETADLLIKAGKQVWIKQRDECVFAKGKGSMQTYWLTNFREHRDAESDGNSASSGPDNGIDLDDFVVINEHDGQGVTVTQHMARLINWNFEQLAGLLKQIVARRSVSQFQSVSMSTTTNDTDIFSADCNVTSPIDEVQEIIALPEFDASANHQCMDVAEIIIPPVVMYQLKAYVTWVAQMYKNNPFHNFDHASHVVMSVIKLMSRIVAPTDQHMDDNAATLHDHTYGITSDPLTQFACVFSALIHDVDHLGVPNTTLVAEHTDVASKYNNRSVAEQNSLDLAWNELMDESKYIELRALLFTDHAELIRFRKLVVNGVMATDIADKDLKTLRNNRWDKAFIKAEHPNDAVSSKQDQRDAVNRKATIVIEHLIQASDVSHTMQHWHVFRKWNQALFEEMYEAYRTGRAATNPADFWYQGEIGFFDYYIIPLAKKLKDCGVFGVSSDEYLNYAMKNREEWEMRGPEIVMEMVEAVVVQNGHLTNKIES